MQLQVIIGIFFMVLAVIFGVSALRQYVKAQGSWTPAGKTHRKMAITFVLVGVGLVIWRLIFK